MPVRLRAHHLLCLLTYSGTGYTPAFTINFNKVIARIGAGEEVLIVAGADDICAPLLDQPDAHCRRESVQERDALAARDLGKLLDMDLAGGQRLTLEPELLLRMRRAFVGDAVREACAGCEWHGLCTAVARANFCKVSLAPRD